MADVPVERQIGLGQGRPTEAAEPGSARSKPVEPVRRLVVDASTRTPARQLRGAIGHLITRAIDADTAG